MCYSEGFYTFDIGQFYYYFSFGKNLQSYKDFPYNCSEYLSSVFFFGYLFFERYCFEYS
jgi:hypothetical protein